MTGIQWMYVPNSHLTSDKPRKSVMVGPPVMPDKRLQVCIKRFEVQALSTTGDRKSTRLNSSHSQISYAVFCLKNTDTVACLNSLGAAHPRPARVILVDNGSTDGSLELLRASAANPGLSIIASGANLSFSGVHN